ncbi:hypothetical protein GCM10027176_34820 [Actinoallomurus bryophytorum]
MTGIALSDGQHLEEAEKPDAECDQDEHGGKDEHASQRSSGLQAPTSHGQCGPFVRGGGG